MTERGRLRILGRLDACDGDVEVDLAGRRQRAVLAVLVLARGESVPAERIDTHGRERDRQAVSRAKEIGVLDGLVARVLQGYPYRFTVATTSADKAVAFALRGRVVGADVDRDGYDDVAVHVIGWADDVAVSTGRLVFPPHPLPTEDACGLVVEPAGQVVDVGRMCVAPEYRSYRQAAFIALLCRLYREMRDARYGVACGMMAPRVRRLLGQLGLTLEQLAPDRPHLGEDRAPVRFSLMANGTSLPSRWA